MLFNYNCLHFLPTPSKPTSFPRFHSPPWFCPCVLYSSSWKPFSPLSPPPSPLALTLFLISMTLKRCFFFFVGLFAFPVQYPYAHSSAIYNSHVLETAKVPVSRWVEQKTVVPLHKGTLHSKKKEGTRPICNTMDETGEYYAKWNKPVGERQIPYEHTYKMKLMTKINYWTK